MAKSFLKKKKLTSLVILLLIAILDSHGQHLLNLDFEIIDSDTGLPKSWYVDNEDNVLFNLDSSIFHSGVKSLCISTKNPIMKGSATIVMQLDSSLFKSGDNIKIAGFIKTKGKGFDKADLAVNQFTSNLTANTVPNTKSHWGNIDANGWRELISESKITQTTSRVTITLAVSLDQPIWIDNFEIKINEKRLEEVKQRELIPPSPLENEWLSKHLIPLSPSSDFADYAVLESNQHLKFKKVFAIGEATHGSSEVYEIKNNLTKYLISYHDYSTLAIEMEPFDAQELNKYIQGGNIKLDATLSATGYWIWKTKEFSSLMEWLRKFNESKSNKIKIIGIDIPFSNNALSILKSYSPGSSRLSKIFTKIDSLYSLKDIKKNDATSLKKLVNLYEEESIKQDILRDKKSNETLLSAISSFQQQIGFRESTEQNIYRDSCMAMNLSTFLNSNVSEKLILWAHNGHVSKVGKSLGALINEKNPVYSLAFAIGKGYFNGISQLDDEVKPHRLLPPISDSYESYFNIQNQFSWFISLSFKKNENKWLSEAHNFRFTGVMNSRYQFSLNNLQDAYDGVIFLKESTPSHLIF